MTDKTTAERETPPAEKWLRGRYGAYRGHPSWRDLEEAFQAGRASLPLPGAQEAVAAKLKALRASIAGDCYLGDLEELELIDAILAAPQPALSAGWQPIETEGGDK